jgi:transcriptional regulator with XRE-family HTH domain
MAVANVGQNLQRARENAGFEQETAAPKLGVHPQTLSRYERGTVAKIPATILEKASNLYGVPMDRLISGLIESGESLGVSVSRGTEVSTPEAALPPSHAKLIRDFER